jgi:hypothetical protein
MNGLVFYIGLGLGLALAAGVRPFLPALLAGGLGSAGALGVSFAHSSLSFLQAGWWLAALAAALLIAWLLQLRLGVERFEGGPLGAIVAGLGVGLGALLFGATLGQHGDSIWPGLLGGALAAILAQAALRPLLGGARTRLSGDGNRSAREALTLYADVLGLVLAALVCLLHPLGYLALAPFAWLAAGTRRRAGEKYAGLRILGR